MNKSALMNKYMALNKQCQGMQDYADLEGWNLTPAEQDQLDGLMAEAESIEQQINALGGIPGPGRQTQPQQPGMGPHGAPYNQGFTPSGGRMTGPGAGFQYPGINSLGELAQAVKNSSARGGTVDPRLILNAPTTTSSEGIGADGGFMVPPQTSREIFSTIMGEESLISRTNMVPTTSNTYIQVLDDGPPWATTGPQAYWKAEAAQLTQSKVALKEITKRLCKLTALVPVTEELLEDAPSLDGYLRRKIASIFDFKINLAILQGTGAGEPLGLLHSDALITVDAETGQDADTIVYENLINMWGRLAPGSEKNAVWLMHKDCWPQLLNLTQLSGLAGTPIYLPPDGAAGRPYQSLMGRPIVTTQACETLGDKLDLVLADLSQYQTIVKTSGLKTDVSMHLWFDYSVLAYKWQIRIDGASLWPAAVAARDGSNTYSPFVALAERAG